MPCPPSPVISNTRGPNFDLTNAEVSVAFARCVQAAMAVISMGSLILHTVPPSHILAFHCQQQLQASAFLSRAATLSESPDFVKSAMTSVAEAVKTLKSLERIWPGAPAFREIAERLRTVVLNSRAEKPNDNGKRTAAEADLGEHEMRSAPTFPVEIWSNTSVPPPSQFTTGSDAAMAASFIPPFDNGLFDATALNLTFGYSDLDFFTNFSFEPSFGGASMWSDPNY